ncbi:MAG: ABC transporter ATP-binding protein [Vallitalea sp.]|jgi:simple sugar transport system ATP-binding protein|nr:ABC transporter ATP-binding protein [Vallitalea sp.]
MLKDILKMENITKIYPNGVRANENVNFSVREGEIHALMGENGAGKSTLMKILFGIESHQTGSIHLRDEKIEINSPNEAIAYGIGMVHQHFMLVPSLSVAENIVLGIEPEKKGLLDSESAIRMTAEAAKKYNLKVDPKTRIEDMPVGQRQKVEILKALIRGADILILDEPTAVLTPQETEELFAELVQLKNQGHTIIFISHKLSEIKAITDRITIMRNGKVEKVVVTEEVSEKDISRLMVGRDVMLTVDKEEPNAGGVILKLDNIHYREGTHQLVNGVSFSLREGEILGIAGVEGNGQSEIAELITGMKKSTLGIISINNQKINDLTIREIRELGIAHIHEDRMSYGVAKEATITDNIISERFYKSEFNIGPFLNMKKIRETAELLVEDFKAKCSGINQKIKGLSGGNIQKIVVAREFSSNPKLIVANQPSRGIDVGSTEFIYKKLVELRDSGSAVLLVSADLNEVMELSDRLIVMYNGEITAHFDNVDEVDINELGTYMLGIKKQSESEIRRAIYV